MRLEDRLVTLGPDDASDLADAMEDLRHDLGKYVVFETRFLGAEPTEAELRRALRADLLATRRRGDARQAAWEVWADLRPDGLDDDPDVRVIDAALDELSALDLDGAFAVLARARDLAAAVALATRRIHARSRRPSEE